MNSSAFSVPLLHVDVMPQEEYHPSSEGGSDQDGSTATLSTTHHAPSFLAAAIKLYLIQAGIVQSVQESTSNHEMQGNALWCTTLSDVASPSSSTRRGILSTSCTATKDNDSSSTLLELSVLYLPQNNILLPPSWPCHCHGYVDATHWRHDAKNNLVTQEPFHVHVTASTTVHVLPWGHDTNTRQPREQFTRVQDACAWWLVPTPPPSPVLQQDVISNHNPGTRQELAWQCQRLWRHCHLRIGSTADALVRHRIRQSRKAKFGQLWRRKSTTTVRDPELSHPQDEPLPQQPQAQQLDQPTMLVVHSPDHGAGKTLLVRAIVQQLEPTAHVHVISCATLLAKSRVAADAVLESTVHQIVHRAALQQVPVCVVLDDLQAVLPANSAPSGDAAVPVLHALTAWLRILQRCMQQRFVPFPSKNPLYNICEEDGDNSHGHVFSVHFLLVGILTCPDHGGQQASSSASQHGTATSIWETLSSSSSMVSRYRVPTLTAATRWTTLRTALDRAGVSLTKEAEAVLPRLAASAVSARGAAFGRIAQAVPRDSCNVYNLRVALAPWSGMGGSNVSSATKVSFESSSASTHDLFGSVGGNTEAKLALHEALSLDPQRRALLTSFGLSPPTGILLYGPPGTGKTLLAKAVAKILQTQTASAVGGAFVSLSSSDIVHAEVGTGEKLLVSAFETARMNAPSVVFIDEFQALFTDRSQPLSSSRFSSTLLSLLDDIRRWEVADRKASASGLSREMDAVSQRVVVLAATNTPWMVDKAFLRPGRFDHVVHVGLPDLADRQKIFELLIRQMKTTMESDRSVQDFSKKLARATDGYSGADISVICRNAAVNCLVASQEQVEEKHFLAALGEIKASSSPALVKQISSWTV